MRQFLGVVLVGMSLLPVAGACGRGRQAEPVPSLLSPALAPPTFPLTLTDCSGEPVVIPAVPRRIVSLAPNLTEILFALGLGQRIVGVTRYCDYPAEALRKPKVGGGLDPNLELIAAQDPDLVLAYQGIQSEILSSLRSLGIAVLVLCLQDWDAMLTTIKEVGQATGAYQQAQALMNDLVRRRDAVLARVPKQGSSERPRVLVLHSLTDLRTAGPGSFLHQLIEWAGGENIAADSPVPWVQYSMEKVLEKNPDVIVATSEEDEDPRALRQKLLAEWPQDERWRQVKAVQRGRIEVIPVDWLTIPGPRLLNGLEALAQALHPSSTAP